MTPPLPQPSSASSTVKTHQGKEHNPNIGRCLNNPILRVRRSARKSSSKDKEKSSPNILRSDECMQTPRCSSLISQTKKPSVRNREKSSPNILRSDECMQTPRCSSLISQTKKPSVRNRANDNCSLSPEILPYVVRPSTRLKKGVKSNQCSADADVKRQSLVPEYFPLRKSVRLNDAYEQMKIKHENEMSIIKAILNGREVGFEVRLLPEKGRGVFVQRTFRKGDFVLEYAGTLRSLKDAKKCERVYSQNYSLGCFMFYFKYLNKSYCVDATEETPRLGRLVNHSRLKQNLCPKIVSVNGRPRIVLFANREISIGDELLYDYGDRSAASLRSHPWLAT